ncbi:MAG: hypothetical protein ACOZBZ_03350 [Patescibacteria group bacterium]
MNKLPFPGEVQPPERLNLFKESPGQALLIILLVMAVALTIGLSVISRSITDIKISQQTEEAARAFSAAEAGIEEALVAGTSGSGTFAETGATYQTAVAGFGEGTEFVFPQEIQVDEPQTLYLAKYETDGALTKHYTAGTIDVCWDGDAALEIAIYYQDGSTYKVARAVVDPVDGRTPGADFPSGQCAGLEHKKTLSLPTGGSITLLFLRLRVLYANTKVGVSTPGGAGGTLPSQGNRIESTGTAGTSTRKVEVVRFYPAPPEIFDFAVYSGGSLSK